MIFEIIKFILIFLISIFLPKKITYIIRSIVFYYFKNIIKFWPFFLLELILFFYFYLYKSLPFFQNINNLKTYLLTLTLSTLTINLYYVFRTLLSKSKTFFSIYPSFTIKENEFIINDIQSEKINDIIKDKINLLKPKFYVFRNNIVKVELVILPEFIPIILGIKGFTKYISKKLNPKNPISLYIQKDLLDSTLDIQFFYDNKQFINTNDYIEIKKITKTICQDKDKSIDAKIESILFLLLFIHSQSFLESTLIAEAFEDTFHILNDLDEQLMYLRDDLKTYKIEPAELDNFIRFWKGSTLRYFSIVYLEKNDIEKSIECIFQANEINPYAPHSEYKEAKSQYISNYLFKVMSQVNNISDSIGLQTDNKEISKLKINLLNKINLESSAYNHLILLEIIARNLENHKVLKLIENRLKKVSIKCENIFSLLFVSEAYKFLPLGEQMENGIYVNRIPMVVALLKKAISLDIDFDLLHLKIGGLLFIYGNHKSEVELTKSLDYIDKYSFLYSKYGLK